MDSFYYLPCGRAVEGGRLSSNSGNGKISLADPARYKA